jgi:hypothetical protein
VDFLQEMVFSERQDVDLCLERVGNIYETILTLDETIGEVEAF